MNLYKHLGIDQSQLSEYINQGLIDTSHHDTLPLVIFTYGRKAVQDSVWDDVIVKCRGLIVDENTDEIIARPFEKFFNHGQTAPVVGYWQPEGDPEVYEKLRAWLVDRDAGVYRQLDSVV